MRRASTQCHRVCQWQIRIKATRRLQMIRASRQDRHSQQLSSLQHPQQASSNRKAKQCIQRIHQVQRLVQDLPLLLRYQKAGLRILTPARASTTISICQPNRRSGSFLKVLRPSTSTSPCHQLAPL